MKPVARRKRARRIRVRGCVWSTGLPAGAAPRTARFLQPPTHSGTPCAPPWVFAPENRSCSRVRRRMPSPSAPKHQGERPLEVRRIRASASPRPSVPTTQTPRCLSASRVRARLVTLATGTNSAAPAATLRAAPSRRGSPIPGNDHRVGAGGIGGPQARPEIVGIRDPVEDEQQGIDSISTQCMSSRSCSSQLFKRPHCGNRTLVRHLAHELGERIAGDAAEPARPRAAPAPSVGRTRASFARLRHPELESRSGARSSDGAHRMQAIDIVALCISHGRRVRRACRRPCASRRAVLAPRRAPRTAARSRRRARFRGAAEASRIRPVRSRSDAA